MSGGGAPNPASLLFAQVFYSLSWLHFVAALLVQLSRSPCRGPPSAGRKREWGYRAALLSWTSPPTRQEKAIAPLNTFTFTGRVVADHDGPRDVSGTPVLNFRVVSDTGFDDRKSALWLGCALWGKRAEVLALMLAKGQYVAISGELPSLEH